MINVPLKSLIPGGAIDSRNGGDRQLDSLVNSIANLGLILPLAVVQEGSVYRVIDGNRRLEALKIVHKGKKNVEVPVHIQDPGLDQSTARALSLAANIERLPLHPADQYKAFAAIAADGKPLAEIAASFGISERQVKQQMALGSLCKEALDAYRDGGLDAHTARSLTRITPEEQLKLLLSGEPSWKIRQMIDQQFFANAISPTAGIVRFVSREAYLERGGHLVPDLFVEERDQLLADLNLLNDMALEKMQELQAEVLAAGWSFFERTEHWIGQDYVVEQEPELPEELRIERDRLIGTIGEIEDRAIDENGEGGYSDEDLADLDKYQAELNAIDDRVVEFSDEQKAAMGVVIDSNYQVHYGCTPRKGGTRNDPSKPAPEKAEPSASAALMAELDCHLTNAVHGALVDNPLVALRLLVLSFLCDYYLFDKLQHAHCGVGIRADMTGRAIGASDYGLDRITAWVKECGLFKAKTFEARMKAVARLDEEELHFIVAFMVGRSMMVRHRGSDIVLHLDKLELLDIPAHYTPTKENFFERLSKKQLLMIAAEERVDVKANNWDQLKKDELVGAVMAKLPARWVPEAIRPKKPS